MKRSRKEPKSLKFNWVKAPDIKRRTLQLVKSLDMTWISGSRIFFYRSYGSKTRAYARTWGLPKIWQASLKVPPAYIIEVLSGHFDGLSQDQKDKILLHELTHIPKNFSGALLPHIRRGKRSFHKKVDDLIIRYLENFK
jgi:predicted metallopeptidase